jgi:hypothetical protein
MAEHNRKKNASTHNHASTAILTVLTVGHRILRVRRIKMPRMAIIVFSAAVLVSMGAAAAQRSQQPLLEVFKSPTCGCCSQWVEHMRAAGFTVRVTDLEDLTSVKTSRHVPDQIQSCHTGVVNGYVIEGHVPAADVHRLLKERPPVVGVAVPGMPIGSPGMEVEGVKARPYDVMSFDKQGATRVFAKH